MSVTTHILYRCSLVLYTYVIETLHLRTRIRSNKRKVVTPRQNQIEIVVPERKERVLDLVQYVGGMSGAARASPFVANSHGLLEREHCHRRSECFVVWKCLQHDNSVSYLVMIP